MTRERQQPDPAQLRVVPDGPAGLRQGHPSLEHLAAYHEGTIQGEQRERIQVHLVDCRECTRLLLDFARFDSGAPPPGVQELPQGELVAAWTRMQKRVEDEEEDPSHAQLAAEEVASPMAEVRPLRRDAPPAPSAPGSGLLRLAAAILLVAGGLAIWNQLRPGAPSLQANVGVTDETRYLVGHEPPSKVKGSRRGSEERRRLGSETTLSAGQENHLGFPLPEGTQPFESYRLEVVGSPGERRFWSTETRELVSGMEGSGEGFTLRIEPGALPPGLYTAKAYGLDPGRPEELIASYPFKMTQ